MLDGRAARSKLQAVHGASKAKTEACIHWLVSGRQHVSFVAFDAPPL